MLKQIKIRNIIAIMLGAAIFSFGFVHFNMQNQLGEGGLSGITLILYFTLAGTCLNEFTIEYSYVYHRLSFTWKKKSFIYTLVGPYRYPYSLKFSKNINSQFI